MFNSLITSPWTITALFFVPALAGAVISQGPATIGPDQLRIVLGTPETAATRTVVTSKDSADTTDVAQLAPTSCPKADADTDL